ncbi:MAG: hypothetical protein AAF986_07490 [Pseudomonadota bacterium]
MKIIVYRITWRGIDIELVYVPKRWGVIASLEIRSFNPPKAPLPITYTGYRSHFHPMGTVEASGGDVVAMVIQCSMRKPKQKNGKHSRTPADRGSCFNLLAFV